MSGYTPGPWVVAPEHDKHWLWVGPEKWNTRVARIVLYDREEAEQAANARLIAASPDLLVELERTRDWLALLSIANVGDVMQGAIEHFNSITAAIRKATEAAS